MMSSLMKAQLILSLLLRMALINPSYICVLCFLLQSRLEGYVASPKRLVGYLSTR